MLHRSTIKEKELNIELDKKPFPPTDRNIFIKKFNLKNENLKKKNIAKIFSSNFFIEKYVRFYYFKYIFKFLTKNTMIHFLFNNIFLEGNSTNNKEKNQKYVFPITNENDHLLLLLLDMYDKVIIIIVII